MIRPLISCEKFPSFLRKSPQLGHAKTRDPYLRWFFANLQSGTVIALQAAGGHVVFMTAD
jgi:hypothetical protein